MRSAAKVDGADAKRIKVTTRPADLADCDLVVEAVVEELEPKVELLSDGRRGRARTPTWRPPPPPSRSTSSARRAATRSASSACTPSTRWCGWS